MYMYVYCVEYVCLCVCLRVCLSVRQDISGTPRAIFTNFMCMLPISEARSFSGTFTIGRIAYRREGVTALLTVHCNAAASLQM